MKNIFLIVYFVLISAANVTADDFKNHSIGMPFIKAFSAFSALFTNLTIDGAADTWEQVFRMPEAATLTDCGFRYGVRTGTPVQHSITLEGVSATTGERDSTDVGGGSPTLANFTPPADTTWNSTWRWVTLTNSYAATRGELLDIVILPVGTPDASNSSSFTYVVTGAQSSRSVVQYAVANGTKNSETPIFGCKSATKTYGNILESLNGTLYSSDSTPDERALHFVLDSGWGSTYTVRGFRCHVRTPAAGDTVKIALYDGTTELQAITWDTDNAVANSSSFRSATFYFDEATLSTLNFGSAYRLGFAPQDTSSNLGLYTIVVAADGDLTAFPGETDWHLSTRTDSGAWDADTTDERPICELFIDVWTEPAGGGGAIPATVSY